VAANRWLAEVYDPVVGSIPAELRDKLDPVEVFHEVLEHRWFLSEQAGRDVGTASAARSYFADVLPTVPDSLTSGAAGPTDADAGEGEDPGADVIAEPGGAGPDDTGLAPGARRAGPP
jgi:hypothetical protein